ncbi:hypothetical protein A2291_05785 [candidate division WOR-1 bacterium RIFOXYB2_FULL_42_35]|uniref:Uncharacterized protein n=1 Tax=candidate division WOR-1 bacterium RIFOXYC2_FULL_41_25 TaxID=1802586 RepID=A0A1F4TKH4_UNCSA|nr:MAG: hypothetical protein A2247_02425 [candidate division WOR-1 bacterium RIFOXYA2_FULL_41_14]OGC22429.1 MAG: hypothetical protein A2291_05785 [candidate division WOR-1 bacterium RIFOXYB2_FULL_42_35]OGC33107.1 MAG: hypothetical protein A2462_08695 [candidate division WOR-1 bacterium RIFOXYC2_FULL_41_25]
MDIKFPKQGFGSLGPHRQLKPVGNRLQTSLPRRSSASTAINPPPDISLAPLAAHDNIENLCLLFIGQLRARFPFLTSLGPTALGSGEKCRIIHVYRRLTKRLEVIRYFQTHGRCSLKSRRGQALRVFNLIYNKSSGRLFSGQLERAWAAAGLVADAGLTASLKDEITAEFDSVIKLELAPKRERSKESTEEKTARLRQEAIQYFIDNPRAQKKDLPGRIWRILYRLKLFPGGIEEAKGLACK